MRTSHIFEEKYVSLKNFLKYTKFVFSGQMSVGIVADLLQNGLCFKNV